MRSEPIVSVIIPVYCAERYLRECLDSLLSQSLENWEAICIDDGSTDSSGKVLDEYEKNDARIKVFHKDNAGVSTARNEGIQYAEGRYLAFLDADDRMEPDMLEVMCRKAEEYHADIVECGINLFGDIPEDDNLVKYTEVEDRVIVPYTRQCLFFMKAYLWNKIYRRSFWRDSLLLKNLTVGEDLAMNAIFLLRNPNYVGISDRLYSYRQTLESVMRSTGAYHMWYSEHRALEAIAGAWEEVGRLEEVADDLAGVMFFFLNRRLADMSVFGRFCAVGQSIPLAKKLHLQVQPYRGGALPAYWHDLSLLASGRRFRYLAHAFVRYLRGVLALVRKKG
ncbi:MAG: glycosyltransferase [Akkermansia muciniphila]|nr:glycosyltransferase [Akkermansia muciniphila]